MKLIGNRNQRMAVDRRRKVIEEYPLPDILSKEELRIYSASTKKRISEISDDELIKIIPAVTKRITQDVGLKQASEAEMARFTQILKTYYHDLGVSEVSIAFELSSIGKLNDYLPLDKNGQPDNNHYQSFSIGYIAKILNAYKKRLADIEAKIYRSTDKLDNRADEKAKTFYELSAKMGIINAYLYYKYHGKVNFSKLNDYLVYSFLQRIGMDVDIIVTKDDMESGAKQIVQKGQSGRISGFVADCVRTLGVKHSYVPEQAYIIARRRSIVESFENMVIDEVQITDYIHL